MSRAGNSQSVPPSYHAPAHPGTTKRMKGQGYETTPLLRSRAEEGPRKHRVYALLAIYVVTIILTSIISIAIYKDSSHESLCEHIRKDTREKWELEKQHHDEEALQWKEEIEGYRRQKSTLNDSLEALLSEIEEKGDQLKGLERRSKQVEHDIQDALEQLKTREREVEKKESETLERVREFERQLQKEKEEYAKIGLYWADPQPAERCLGHNSIEYTARLANVRPSVDAVKACHSTPLTLYGKTYKSPDYCEDLGEGNVYGHWVVNGEYKCQTFWESNFRDKGCTMPGSGARRFERSFGAIHEGQDWESLCYTTPADIMKQHFDRPLMCLHRGIYGIWGYWDVRDPICN